MTVARLNLATGVTLEYVERGDPDGTPVIFLHGVTDSWRSFEHVLPHLPPSIRAIAITQRGHGDSSRPDAGYAYGDFAADVAALLDAVGVIAGGPRRPLDGRPGGAAFRDRPSGSDAGPGAARHVRHAEGSPGRAGDVGRHVGHAGRSRGPGLRPGVPGEHAGHGRFRRPSSTPSSPRASRCRPACGRRPSAASSTTTSQPSRAASRRRRW